MTRFILCIITLFSSLAMAEDDSYVYFSPQMCASHLREYNDEEKEAIEKDLRVIKSICFSNIIKDNQDSRKPLYIATAGGPGARKTTILERFLNNHSLSSQVVYLDPDQRGLKFMAHTYYSKSLCALVSAEQPNYLNTIKNAYEKWRWASNYITLTLLEEAFAEHRDIAHGTTSTGDHASGFLSNIKNHGYETILLLCNCEDSVREKAIRYRNEEQKFYQNTPEDALSKGIAFPLKMSVYFTHADTLYLYWSDELFAPERLAAVFKEGSFQVYDDDAYQKFIHKYESDRAFLSGRGTQILSWNDLVELYQDQ